MDYQRNQFTVYGIWFRKFYTINQYNSYKHKLKEWNLRLNYTIFKFSPFSNFVLVYFTCSKILAHFIDDVISIKSSVATNCSTLTCVPCVYVKEYFTELPISSSNLKLGHQQDFIQHRLLKPYSAGKPEILWVQIYT